VLSTSLGGPGRVSVRFDYEIHRAGDGRLIASGWTVHACINGEGRVVRIPPAMREAIGLPAGPAT